MKRIFIFVLLTALLLSGCRANSVRSADLFAMDTLMNIKVWGGSKADLDAVTQELNRLDAMLSVTNSASELSQLNQNGSAQLSDEAVQILQTALDISRRTDGAFDPTVYPLVQLWGFTDEVQSVPQADLLSQTLARVGVDGVSITGQTVLLQAGTQLDFGGIAKGYAAETCAGILEAAGVTAALLSLGGNVQTLGTKPDGTNWIIGIADPQQPTQAIATLTFSGSLALVTSGGYQRYFEQDGKRYHHILDPKTGYPAQSGLSSVTILAQSGTLADGLSTALFVKGLASAIEFWKSSDDFEAVFITDAGEIFATQGAAPLLKDCDFTVISR